MTWSTARLSPGFARIRRPAVALGAEHVFHLHRLDGRQRLARLDLLALRHGERGQQSRHRRQQQPRVSAACFSGIRAGARRRAAAAPERGGQRRRWTSRNPRPQPLDLHGHADPSMRRCITWLPGCHSVAARPALAVNSTDKRRPRSQWRQARMPSRNTLSSRGERTVTTAGPFARFAFRAAGVLGESRGEAGSRDRLRSSPSGAPNPPGNSSAMKSVDSAPARNRALAATAARNAMLCCTPPM